MQTYKEFQPTGFDSRGLALPDQQKWLVLPCSRNRDSCCLDESNFATALEMLGGEGDDVEVHRFGHWACGWFEIIIVKPDSKAESIAFEIEDGLENYPVLDEDDLSKREWEAAEAYWDNMSLRDRMEACKRFGLSVFAARSPYIPEDPQGGLMQYLAE